MQEAGGVLWGGRYSYPFEPIPEGIQGEQEKEGEGDLLTAKQPLTASQPFQALPSLLAGPRAGTSAALGQPLPALPHRLFPGEEAGRALLSAGLFSCGQAWRKGGPLDMLQSWWRKDWESILPFGGHESASFFTTN